MQTSLPIRRFLTLSVACLMLSLAPGCATSGGAAAPAAPSGPIELDGTRWKLVMLAGALDGRVVEFHKRGSDGYSGKLIEMGRKLRDAMGVQPGFELFQLKRKKENEYEGVYKAVDASGAVQNKEVVVFVAGNNLNWNQESAVWERQ
jgi:hypothetical protein